MARKGKRSPTKRPAATGFTSDEGSTSGGSSQKRRRIESEEEEEEQTPVPPPPRKTLTKGKPGRKIIKSKALQKKPPKPRKTMSMKELCADWNRTGRVGLASKTAQGWLRKTEKKREGQQRALRRARPGVRALREIRHYQRCQTFLIPILPFQRLVREVSLNSEFAKEGLRWQSTALFSLQSSAEAYMAGYFHDVHLCALHRKVKMINRQDIWLAIKHKREGNTSVENPKCLMLVLVTYPGSLSQMLLKRRQSQRMLAWHMLWNQTGVLNFGEVWPWMQETVVRKEGRRNPQ